MRTRRVFLAGVAAALACAGASAQDLTVKSVAPKDGGTLTGTVKIDGAPPRSKKIKMDADPKCAALHAEPMLTEEVVADAAGNVKWAFVYVKKGPSVEKEHKAPSTPAMLDQKGCKYEPHVLGVMVGQDLLLDRKSVV